jgi:hypothetical protein
MTKLTAAEKLEIAIDLYEKKGTKGLELIAATAKKFGINEFTIQKGSRSHELTYLVFNSMDEAKAAHPSLESGLFSYLPFDGGVAITTEEIEHTKKAA